MPRIHGLQHVKGFRAATLTHNNPVRAHTQSVFQQVALENLSRALDTGRACFHPADMGLLQLQFSGILNGDQAFMPGDVI